MRKLVTISIVIALVVAMLPAVASADDGDIRPRTYATIPFAIVGSGLVLLGEIVATILEAVMGTVFGIPRILAGAGNYVADPVADTVNNLTAETADTAGEVCEVVDDATSLNTGGLANILNRIACLLLAPFGSQNYTGADFNPCS